MDDKIGTKSGWFENRQLIKMAAVEAFTYSLFGILLGCFAGLPIHKFLYKNLVISRWGEPWHIPFQALCVIIIVIAAASVTAVYGPAKRIQNLTIVDTIAAQQGFKRRIWFCAVKTACLED